MECLYAPDFSLDSSDICVQGDEARHARALRLRVGDAVLLSNGEGLVARGTVAAAERDAYTISVVELLPNHGELPYRVAVALGILDNKDRMEFALEKAVELGATDFIPLHTRFCQRDKVNVERLQSKALAAMKQAQRACLLRVHEPVSVGALSEQWGGKTTLVVADENGENNTWPKGDICIVVGPEGGLSAEELETLYATPNCTRIVLAQRRLRAETAAVLAVGLAGIHKPV